jgi:hypothetical protein
MMLAVSRCHPDGALGEQGDVSQAVVVAFMSDGANLPGGGPVEVIQTHGAFVFLAGASAYKIKRAVRYDYLDFSTLEKRHDMLLRKLELNAPAAPQIYRDVIAVTCNTAGQLALGGPGQVVEWVLRMERFESDKQLDRIATDGGLSDVVAVALGEAVAAYHATAPRRPKADGPALIGAILDELNCAFVGMSDALGGDLIDQFRSVSDHAMPHLKRILRDRAQAGHVRRFHGDLHLRNVALIAGAPVLFDALEFDETLGTGDVLYDLAFLVMDLLHRGLSKAANLTLGAYLFKAADPDHDAGLSAFPLFMSIRAAIRAMTMVQTARLVDDSKADLPEARAYMKMAVDLMQPSTARLIAIGGLSGTGKSTLAADLAPFIGKAPGAIHLRSDLERKALFGVDPSTRLPPDAYGDPVSRSVHGRMIARALRILHAGHSVVMDATFLKEEHRATLGAMAEHAGTHLEGLWLEAPIDTLAARVTARVNDASDADAGVVRAQAEKIVPPLFWTPIDASDSRAVSLHAASAALCRSQGAADQP